MAKDRFRIGQIEEMVYIHDLAGDSLLHLAVKGPQQARLDLHMGACIELNKEYGPLVFMPLRIKLDITTCEWVIERGDRGNEWREVGRYPGQIPGDFVV